MLFLHSKLKTRFEVNVENVWISISKKGCKYTVLCIMYRHPNYSFHDFGSILDNKISDTAKLGIGIPVSLPRISILISANITRILQQWTIC